MEQVSELKAALTHMASRKLNDFERALKRELAKKDEVHQTQIKKLQEQISFLRQQESRANELEHKFQHVRCRTSNEHLSDPDACPSCPKNERSNAPQGIIRNKDYNDLHERFLRCSLELERVKKAMQRLQISAKKFRQQRDALDRVLLDANWRGIRKSEKFTGRTLRPGSAPEARQLSRTRSVDVVTSAQEKPNPVTQAEGILAEPDLPDFQNQDKQQSEIERSEHNGSSPECEIRSSQTQDDSDAETANYPMYRMPQVPQPRDISSPERDLLVAHGTDDAVKQEPVSPIITDVKTVKRRRGRSPGEAPPKSKRVKEEPSSSSPIILQASIVARGAQESIDLDEIPNVLYTPRKYQGKRWQMRTTPPRQSFSQQHLRYDDEEYLSGEIDTLLEGIGDGSPDFDNRHLPETDLDYVQDEAHCHEMGKMLTAKFLSDLKSQRRSEARAKQGRHNRQERTKHMAVESHSADTQAFNQFGHDGLSSRPVLQPVEANKAPPKNINNHRNPPTKPVPSWWHHGAQYIHYLSEDGENAPESDHDARGQQGQAVDPTTPGETAVSSRRSKPSAEGRLDQLLTRPSPDKPSLSPEKRTANLFRLNKSNTPSSVSKQNPPSTSSKTPSAGQRTQSTATKPTTAPQSTTKTPNIPPPAPTYATPFSKSSTSKPPAKPDPPLRSRPLSHLFPEDFKVNPAQNQGYSHPFKEVVRSKEQRDCLPGCTRLECCGRIFRQMAETGLIKPFHTKRLFASSQEDENVRLMEDFLGDEAYLLRTMSESRKAEILLQAKTKILANHYGRHREVYAREPSPVGFWDVDMPSTQQAEEQVKLAEIRKKQKVEERYREAMRGNGYWKFRDE